MAYTFRGNFQFELAKACISQQRIPAPPGRPSLSEALNYACQFRKLQGYSKFRSKQGLPLQFESSPFFSRQPEQICLLALRGRAKRSGGARRKQSSDIDRGRAKKAASPESVSPQAALPDTEPLPSRRERYTPALLSVTLAVLVAVTVGLAVARSGAFHMKAPQLAQVPDQIPTQIPAQTANAAPDSPAASETVALKPTLAPALQEASPMPLPEPKAARPIPRKRVKHAKRKHAKPHPASPPAAPAEPFPDDRHLLDVQAAPPKKTPAGHTVRTELARCQRYAGLIGRERCKWRVCNHKWGKDGCPAYAQPSRQAMMGIAMGASAETQSAASSPRD